MYVCFGGISAYIDRPQRIQGTIHKAPPSLSIHNDDKLGNGGIRAVCVSYSAPAVRQKMELTRIMIYRFAMRLLTRYLASPGTDTDISSNLSRLCARHTHEGAKCAVMNTCIRVLIVSSGWPTMTDVIPYAAPDMNPSIYLGFRAR